MTKKTVDLSKLKDEISARKNKKPTSVNEGTTYDMPVDGFLNGLVNSLQTGRESESTKLIKMVENKVAGKSVVPLKKSSGTMASELSNVNTKAKPTPHANDQEREHLLYEELERKKKEMLGGTPSANIQQSVQPQGNVINEAKLYETVDNVIKDKFAHIVEHAMKDSIVEIYAVTRMKEVLEENRKLIKEMVYETIRELQQKGKKSQ